MSMNPSQRILLQTNLARDKAEALVQGLRQALAESEAKAAAVPPGEQESEEQRAMRRFVMGRAIASAQRVVDNLNAALRIAEQGGLDPDELAGALEAIEADEDDDLGLGPLIHPGDDRPTGPA